MAVSALDSLLIPREAIEERTAEIAHVLSREYEGLSVVVVGVLNGAQPFLDLLLSQSTLDAETVWAQACSYGADTVSAGVKKLEMPDIDLAGRHVLVVEDIVDTGHTVAELLRLLSERQPASLKVCSLLSKPSRREIEVHLDYVGFEIENLFVVGFGMDHANQYRELRDIWVFRE